MAIKKFKPKTPSLRATTVIDYKKVLTEKKPQKNLVFGLRKKSGRSAGRVSVRHKGGGVKQLYRLVDFKQDKFDIPGKIVSVEYDPNRFAFISLVNYADGEKRYILAPGGIKKGDMIITSKDKVSSKLGNRTRLLNIKTGTPIHNIEIVEGKGGQIAKSAGSYCLITAFENQYAHIKLPSGEVRKVDKNCFASYGFVSNSEHNKISIGKAGRTRWMGIRPTVRGKAMHPGAHPHGGGEGRSSVGLKHPKTPWGKPAKGVKTRKKNKSDKLVVKKR